MPLVVLCGNPSSGKSNIAHALQEECLRRGGMVDMVNEESLHIDRNNGYKDVTTEKMTRGFLRSEVARRLQKTKVLIFDSVNLIKGYRYEIWCLARSASTRACLVHVDTEVDVCKEWNHGREYPYDESVFDDLASRLERPDSKNRWEAPLYTVRPTLGKEHIEYMCKEVMDYAVPIERASHGNRADCGTPVESKPVVRDLTPTLATRGQGLSSTNLLHDIDKEVQSVVKHIIEVQGASAGNAPGTIRFGHALPPLHMNRQMPMPELRRHKRMFIKMVTNNALQRGLSNASEAKPMFINFLSEQLHPT